MQDQATDIDWETDLVELLNELSGVQDELLDVLARKQKRMAECDVEGLAATQPAEQELAGRLEACQVRRKALLDRAAAHGLPSKNIRQLASAVATPAREKIGKQVKVASARMRLLQHQSLTNWVLAQRTLLHLSQMLEIIATGGRFEPTYGREGSAVSRGSLVDRAA